MFMTSLNCFDPIKHLEINNLNSTQVNKLRPILYKDMAKYLLERFVKSLKEEQLVEVERKLPEIKTYSDLTLIVGKYDSKFEEKKIIYLKDYKLQFDLNKFLNIFK